MHKMFKKDYLMLTLLYLGTQRGRLKVFSSFRRIFKQVLKGVWVKNIFFLQILKPVDFLEAIGCVIIEFNINFYSLDLFWLLIVIPV